MKRRRSRTTRYPDMLKQLKYLAVISILLALGAFSVPPVLGESAMPLCFALAFVWAALLVFVLVGHGKRGLWLLLGAPFALYWLVAVASLWVTCSHSSRPCG
jgi:hypothetical protein